MRLPTLQELLEAGVHFGHRTKKWNPKMKPFIYTAREGIHVVDLSITKACLREAYLFTRQKSKEGVPILFIGTKRQAASVVKREAERAKVSYVTERWIGGLFTNFENIKKMSERLTELDEILSSKDQTKNLGTKEKFDLKRKKQRLEKLIGGLRGLNKLPGLLFIVDPKKETTAVSEAVRMGIPMVALLDTNADPTNIDYPIPGNDDALRSIDLIVKTIADSVIEGSERRKPPSKHDKRG